MFLGEYQHSLDAKGRVILPSRFRARLEEGCVLTKGRDRCLYVFPREEWNRVYEAMREARVSDPTVRDTYRLIFSGASEETPDKQGRVNIPEPLRTYARLDRDVTVAGVGPRIEIWDRAAWEGFRVQAEERYANMPDNHPDLPF